MEREKAMKYGEVQVGDRIRITGGVLDGRTGIVAPRIPPSGATLLITLDQAIDGLWAVSVNVADVERSP
jgi:hypothetical protein